MDEGNEGDAIIFYSLKHIECNIPENVTSISQINPDLLVEIVNKSLFLISGGTTQVNSH